MAVAPSYTVIEPLRRDRARIRFTGPFEGREVTWDAEIIALGADAMAPTAPYLDIGSLGDHGRTLRVGLAVAALDPPTLAKTVIMIRNYKRLRRGHMHFGEGTLRLTKVISGGQTGVDRAALDAARARGLEIGGYCPRGRRAEDGRIPPHYPLIELGRADYAARTRRNAAYADATLILTRGRLTGGTAYTATVARRLGKPLLVVDLASRPRVADVSAWLTSNAVGVLNIAGPRETKAPGIYRDAKRYLYRLWPTQPKPTKPRK